jgi:DnaJ-class molecular chaperone
MTQTLPIFIPMGVMNNTIITLSTEQGGKINVKILEINDTKFVRDGYNLILHLDITLTQALISDHVTMGHFNGVLSVPTQIPHTNYRHIIPGMGMPVGSAGVRSGDLYIVYNVLLPKDISTDFAHNLLDLSY